MDEIDIIYFSFIFFYFLSIYLSFGGIYSNEYFPIIYNIIIYMKIVFNIL